MVKVQREGGSVPSQSSVWKKLLALLSVLGGEGDSCAAGFTLKLKTQAESPVFSPAFRHSSLFSVVLLVDVSRLGRPSAETQGLIGVKT